MPPPLLVDLNRIDLETVLFDANAVEAVNPHRYEMRHLDGVVHFDPDADVIVGYKDVREDEFWVRGHIPGRPILPGVIMVEAAAQLASFAAHKTSETEGFIGFGGIEEVKFRISLVPGDRLYLLGKFTDRRKRRFKFAAQGVVNGKLAFEGNIIGMPM